MLKSDFTLILIPIICSFWTIFFKLLSRLMTSQNATLAREGIISFIQKSKLQSKNQRSQNLLTSKKTNFKSSMRMKTCPIAVLDTPL